MSRIERMIRVTLLVIIEARTGWVKASYRSTARTPPFAGCGHGPFYAAANVPCVGAWQARRVPIETYYR
jgi:hypothetical protein